MIDMFSKTSHQRLLSSMKEYAPQFYESFKIRKIAHLNEKLQALRVRFKNSTEEGKKEIIKQAGELKRDLKYYEVEN